MSIINTLLSIFAPYDCIACGAEGVIICKTCIQVVPESPMCCYRCERSIQYPCRYCPAAPLASVQAATLYIGTSKVLVGKMKHDGVQEAARCIADCMLDRCNVPRDAVFVPVPTATKHIRSRGYDHARAIACILAARTQRPLEACLRRSSQTQQAGASRQQRLAQLRDTFWVQRSSAVQGQNIVLVDDVVTTGASLEAAAKALRMAGAQSVSAVVFARTPLRAHAPLTK
jgi:ComF family protein